MHASETPTAINSRMRSSKRSKPRPPAKKPRPSLKFNGSFDKTVFGAPLNLPFSHVENSRLFTYSTRSTYIPSSLNPLHPPNITSAFWCVYFLQTTMPLQHCCRHFDAILSAHRRPHQMFAPGPQPSVFSAMLQNISYHKHSCLSDCNLTSNSNQMASHHVPQTADFPSAKTRRP